MLPGGGSVLSIAPGRSAVLKLLGGETHKPTLTTSPGQAQHRQGDALAICAQRDLDGAVVWGEEPMTGPR